MGTESYSDRHNGCQLPAFFFRRRLITIPSASPTNAFQSPPTENKKSSAVYPQRLDQPSCMVPPKLCKNSSETHRRFPRATDSNLCITGAFKFRWMPTAVWTQVRQDALYTMGLSNCGFSFHWSGWPIYIWSERDDYSSAFITAGSRATYTASKACFHKVLNSCIFCLGWYRDWLALQYMIRKSLLKTGHWTMIAGPLFESSDRCCEKERSTYAEVHMQNHKPGCRNRINFSPALDEPLILNSVDPLQSAPIIRHERSAIRLPFDLHGTFP